MAIQLIHSELNAPIERMLQSLAFLMAYQKSVQSHKTEESFYRGKACEILKYCLGSKEYIVKEEYSYKLLPCNHKKAEEADLVIARGKRNPKGEQNQEKEEDEVLCVIELKMSKDTNGSIFKDVEKLRKVSQDIDRLAVILFREPNDIIRDIFVRKDETPKKDRQSEVISKKSENEKDFIVNYSAKKKKIELLKEETIIRRGKTKLKKPTFVKVKRVTKAYASVYNVNPYMAICIAVIDSEYQEQ